MSGTPLLVAESITAGYGRLDILHGVSLTVGLHEIVSIIGPNGAGKSTAFKTIVGFLTPRSGRVMFNGEDVTGLRPDIVLRRGLAYVPQGRMVFPTLTVEENIKTGIRDDAEPVPEELFTLFPVLKEMRKRRAGTCPAASSSSS